MCDWCGGSYWWVGVRDERNILVDGSLRFGEQMGKFEDVFTPFSAVLIVARGESGKLLARQVTLS
jgi:hypothetical protein